MVILIFIGTTIKNLLKLLMQ